MLYLGHFSFEQTERRRRAPAQASHGYFTCVAEANDVDAALARFARFIHKLRKESELLDQAKRVYIEACVEIRSVPRDGFLAFYNLLDGESQGGISTAVRGATEREAVGFRIGSPDEESPEREYEMKPFVVFEPQRHRARPRTALQ